VHIRTDANNTVEFSVVPVGAKVVVQEQKNEQTARHTNSQTCYIQQCISALGT